MSPGITATSPALQGPRVTVSDKEGLFAIRALPPGAYQVKFELPGFATVTRSGIEMQINQRAVLNLQLAPSTVQETVQVTGEAPLLDLTSSTVSV